MHTKQGDATFHYYLGKRMMIIQSGKGLGRKTQAVLLGECKLVQPVCPAV